MNNDIVAYEHNGNGRLNADKQDYVLMSYFWAQMSFSLFRYLILFFSAIVIAGCANVVPPKGGKKDETPPKLLSVKPADSLLNTKVTKIELRYDEFIELKDQKDIQVSPLLPLPPTVVVAGKKATLEIPDTLLNENTTYRVSLGKSIADLHESNPIKPYTYVFSTGSYFDSLRLDGKVIDAATGRPDTGVVILLYSAAKSDSVVVKEKPIYIGRATGGQFTIAGLPDRLFRIYALKDGNDNLVYDGEGEKIAFIDSIVHPSDSIAGLIKLRLFEEKIPVDSTDTTETEDRFSIKRKRRGAANNIFAYGVSVDTTNIRNRTFDVTQPLNINFTADVDSFFTSRIGLSYDSTVSDSVILEVDVPFTVDTDSVRKDVLHLNSAWKEGAVYTLRLLKGFAKDSAGTEAMPSKHRFRAKSDEDYSKLKINIPRKYYGTGYVLLVKNDKDTVHMKQVTDTVVQLKKLQPGTYQMFIIRDDNENGMWDTGDLFAKKQPEYVIPFSEPMQLRAGWEHVYDFKPEEEKPAENKGQSPKKRDRGFGN